jgi:hypothetical protein
MSNAPRDVDAPFGTESPDPPGGKKQLAKAPMPDIYDRVAVTGNPDPEVREHSLPNIDKYVGFDPYDTGVLQKKSADT